MARTSNRSQAFSLDFWLLAGFLVILWIAGGASRPDAIGQAVVRAAAWAILIAAVLAAPAGGRRGSGFPLLLLCATALVTAAQLLPLPPGVWEALPGRGLFMGAEVALEGIRPWRPLSLSPQATTNALASLIVPLVVLVLAARLKTHEHWRIAALLLALCVASAALGLVEVSGGRFDHPLINDIEGLVSANFANRNHLALFLAMGCALAPAWSFRRGTDWHRLAATPGLLLIFAMVLLATGSRAGMVLGAVATALGGVMMRGPLTKALGRLPRSIAAGVVVGAAAILAGAVWLSFAMGRAVAIDRALLMEAGDDLRAKALPIVLEMIPRYFPAGSGFGTFDQAYRISEPESLLNPLYFNHAHNDWLEIALDGGLPGILLLAVATAWAAWRSFAVWLRTAGADQSLARLGSVLLALVAIASLADYPARTPLIMGIVALAAIWLCPAQKARSERTGESEDSAGHA